MRAITLIPLLVCAAITVSSAATSIGYYDIRSQLSNTSLLFCDKCYDYGTRTPTRFVKVSCSGDGETVTAMNCTSPTCGTCSGTVKISGWSNVTGSVFSPVRTQWTRVKKVYQCTKQIQSTTYQTSSTCSNDMEITGRVWTPEVCVTGTTSQLLTCDGTSASVKAYVGTTDCSAGTSGMTGPTTLPSTGCTVGTSNMQCIYPSSSLCVLMESTTTDMSAFSNAPSAAGYLSSMCLLALTVIVTWVSM